MNMSIRLIAAAGLAVSLHAAASPADTADNAPLIWNCARAGVPSAAEVTTHFDVRNPAKLQATQLHLRAVAQRACATGATTLYIVARPAADDAARFAALVAR